MGTPYFMLQRFEQEKGLLVKSSNYTLYDDMSGRMMRIIGRHVPEQEVYSIDECFARFTGIQHINLDKVGKTIKQQVFQYIGIPVSVGIAETKTLAKMANRYAKKKLRQVGVYCADTQEKKMAMMEWCAVGDVWGIGAQYAFMLEKNGFKTAADLLTAPEDFIREKMTVVGQRLLNELKGIPCIEWQQVRKPKKNICTSRSFGNLTSKKEDVAQAVANFAANCAEKLRREKSNATVVHAFIQTNPHRAQDNQYFHSINVKLAMAANDTPSIVSSALKGLDIIWKDGYSYMKAGVIVQNLKPQAQVQTALFEPDNKAKLNTAMAALDKVNSRFGKDTIKVASQGFDKRYKMRREHLSQCYTTRIEDVVVI